MVPAFRLSPIPVMTGKAKPRVVLAVTGGIAAYKAPETVRRFQDAGLDVTVVLSRAAEAFVSPMVLQTLTGHKCWRQCDFLSVDGGSAIPHITLAKEADAVVLAPCTANHLARLASGDGESLISALCLATEAPVLVCPAMNSRMLVHPATRANLSRLREYGYHLLDSDCGLLACGDAGAGRLPDPPVLLAALMPLLGRGTLKGRKVVITAGPTREFLDPVRFVSNPSTGKMGAALAEAARDEGADVTLLWGPAPLRPPHGVTVVPVVSADDLLAAAKEHLACDLFIAAAAVGDYKAEEYSAQKLKREKAEFVTRRFVRNPDIAAWVGEHRAPGTLLVGFAAETDDLEVEARGKIARKKLDYCVANDVTEPGSGFGTDTNRVILLGADGSRHRLEGSKKEVARALIEVFARSLS